MANVKIYSTPTCPYCIKTKAYLDEKGIKYENLDVSSDKVKLDEMIKLSGQMGVPVLDIDGSVIVGFDKEKIDNSLGG
ncbi:MAG: glutaredoxin domain-containing protein [Candidatus Kuenenbacteria bacterium]